MKKMIKGWLERLESANKESFGNQPLDCCQLGRNSTQKKPVRMTSDRQASKK